MNAAEIERALDDVLDQAIVFHGFTDYMRDYEVYVFATADPRTGITPEHLRLLFRHCVAARVETAVPPAIWRRSLDERLIDYDKAIADDLDGYIWGVCWQVLYPGATLSAESPEAKWWSEQLGIPMHEVAIKTNGHNISLVFSDLTVETVAPGYTPFTVPPSGPDAKIPFP